MKIGDKLHGTITGIKPYGAFVALDNGTTGLIHISEIKTGFIDDIDQLLAIGNQVLVQVIDIDEYSKKASLSMRTLAEEKQHFSIVIVIPTVGTRLALGHLKSSYLSGLKKACSF